MTAYLVLAFMAGFLVGGVYVRWLWRAVVQGKRDLIQAQDELIAQLRQAIKVRDQRIQLDELEAQLLREGRIQ